MFIFTCTWVHIQIKTPDNFITLHYFKRVYRFMPHIRLPRADGHPKHCLYKVKNTLFNLVVMKILTHFLCVNLVLFFFYQIFYVHFLPVSNTGRRRIYFLQAR